MTASPDPGAEIYQVRVVVEAPAEAVASYDVLPWAPNQTRGISMLNWPSIEARHPLEVVTIVLEELRNRSARVVEVIARTPHGYWQFTGQAFDLRPIL